MRIAFDLDGTLIDSAPDIHAAVSYVLKQEGVSPLSLEAVTSFVGNGLPKLVERVIDETGQSQDDHADLTARVLQAYTNPDRHLTVTYPGVIAALEALSEAGHSLGICTNKPLKATHGELARLDLARFFPVVVGGDSFEQRKPDPRPLHEALAMMGDGPTLFVGDSDVDAATADRAGVRFALYTEGYRKAAVHDLPHDRAFSAYEDFVAYVAGLG